MTEQDERVAQAVARFSDAQVKRALKCIEDDGITPNGYRHEWRVASSSGRGDYVTAIDACSCHAGQRNRLCWHRAAVALMYVAGKAA